MKKGEIFDQKMLENLKMAPCLKNSILCDCNKESIGYCVVLYWKRGPVPEVGGLLLIHRRTSLDTVSSTLVIKILCKSLFYSNFLPWFFKNPKHANFFLFKLIYFPSLSFFLFFFLLFLRKVFWEYFGQKRPSKRYFKVAKWVFLWFIRKH